MKSDLFFRGLRGPVGSGKSVCCAIEIFRRALGQEPDQQGKRKTRWAVVRNTNPQLRTTTIKTWLDWFPEDVFGKFNWSVPYTHFMRFGDVEMEVIFLALDRPEDVKKLLSLEATGIWINEAREVPKSIIDACTMRVNRYPSMRDGGATWSGVIADTNAPEEDHWWPIMNGEVPVPDWMTSEQAKMLVLPPDWGFFTQPAAMEEVRDEEGELTGYRKSPGRENRKNMARDYYPRIIQGKTKSWIDVYVMNRLGSIQDGKPVYKMFAADVHVAQEEIPVAASLPVYVGMDFGLTPAAVFAQKVRGRWLIQSEIVAVDMGIVRFAEVVRNELATRYGAAGEAIMFGDPSGDFRAQTDESTPFQILRGAGLRVRPTHSNSPDLRIEAVASQLTKMVEGKPGIFIDRRCVNVVKGFAGGYQYKRLEVSGERYADRPDKNMFSHVHDALQYLMLGAGEGRQLMNSQPRARPVVANTHFNPFDHRANRKVR